MGQKVHPYGFRLGFNKPWRSRWFAKQDYAKLLQEDLELKEELRGPAEVGGRQLDRSGPAGQQAAHHHPHLASGHHHRPQGRGDREAEAGPGAERTKREVFIDIQEVHKPELDAQLVSESIALQLEKRVAFRRAMRKAVDSALRFGCKGIKVRVSGPPERRRNRAQRVVPAGAACRCTRCAPTSTTASPKPTPPTA